MEQVGILIESKHSGSAFRGREWERGHTKHPVHHTTHQIWILKSLGSLSQTCICLTFNTLELFYRPLLTCTLNRSISVHFSSYFYLFFFFFLVRVNGHILKFHQYDFGPDTGKNLHRYLTFTRSILPWATLSYVRPLLQFDLYISICRIRDFEN